jgi:hypothetical protein
MNIIGLIGFSKNIFNSLFGSLIIKDFIIYDLTKREFLLLSFMIINLIGLNFLTIFLW